MKKLLYILPVALLFACGGGEEEKKEASQEDVCKCKALYDEKRLFEEAVETSGATPGEAMDQSKEKFGKEMEACEEIHSSVGDEKFYEMSKECK
jgi:hypothetical protein